MRSRFFFLPFDVAEKSLNCAMSLFRRIGLLRVIQSLDSKVLTSYSIKLPPLLQFLFEVMRNYSVTHSENKHNLQNDSFSSVGFASGGGLLCIGFFNVFRVMADTTAASIFRRFTKPEIFFRSRGIYKALELYVKKRHVEIAFVRLIL